MFTHLADPEDTRFVGGGWTLSTCDGLILDWPHRPGVSVMLSQQKGSVVLACTRRSGCGRRGTPICLGRCCAAQGLQTSALCRNGTEQVCT